MGQKVTGASEVLVSIPHREALLIFGNFSDDYVAEMRQIIQERESASPRPLTLSLFRITNGNVQREISRIYP